MIYLFDDVMNIPDGVIHEAFQLMPPERRQRASRYHYIIDRDLCVLAYWLLMRGLRNEYGITEPPAFTYGKNGKPYLAGHPGVFFNVSHCRAGIVCAVSDNEVGIDIQDVRPFDMDVAKRVCTSDELETLRQSREPERLFCELWTIKESYIKQRAFRVPHNATH